MRLKERVRILQDASMMEELLEYNELYQAELKKLMESDIENSHVPQFPYYQISNEIASSCKPILVKQALLMKGNISLPTGLKSSWHVEAFQLCGDLLYLYPGYKFSCDEIFCTLSLLPTQRMLLRTHNIIQLDIMEYTHGYYAALELETKSMAMIRKHITDRSMDVTEPLAQDCVCKNKQNIENTKIES